MARQFLFDEGDVVVTTHSTPLKSTLLPTKKEWKRSRVVVSFNTLYGIDDDDTI